MIKTFGIKTFLLIGLAIATLFFVYVHAYGQWLIPTDTYYYIALADSLLNTGKLLDVTNIPAKPVVTYQNGVPFLYAFLKTLGLHNISAMGVVSILNFCAWVMAVYPFYKLISYFGLTSTWARGFLLLAFLSSSYLLNYQITPGTDGLFNSGAIWLVYLLVTMYLGYDKLIKTKRTLFVVMISASFIMSMFLVHFSIRILFYQIAFLVSVLLCKHEEKRKIVLFSVLLIATTAFCLAVPYLLFDTTMAEGKTNMYNFVVFNREEPLRIMFSKYLGVGNLFKFMNGYVLLAILLCFIAYSLILGYLKNKIGIVFISVTIALFLLINLLLPSAVVVQAGARYMISTFPLFCLLLMFFKHTRPAAYALIATISTITIINLYTPYPQTCISSFWTSLAKKSLYLPNNTALYTDRSRYAYVFLNGRNNSLPFSSLPPSYNHIWLAGSSEFINSKLKILQETKFLKIDHIKVLFSDNMKHCLSALVQCDITISDTEAKLIPSVYEPLKEKSPSL